jgi:uncharacterized membrane protein
MLLIPVLLLLALLCIGLFAGVMLTLVVLLQPQWNALSKEAYVISVKGFVLIAQGHPLISTLMFAACGMPLIVGIVDLVEQHTIQGTLILGAGLVFGIGCLSVTMYRNVPIYRKVVGWSNDARATDWEQVRHTFYRTECVNSFETDCS